MFYKTAIPSIQIPPPAKANEGQDKNYKGQSQQHFQPKGFIGQRKRQTGHSHRKSQHCHDNAIAHHQKPKSIHRNSLSLHAHQHIHHQTGAKAKSGISQVRPAKGKSGAKSACARHRTMTPLNRQPSFWGLRFHRFSNSACRIFSSSVIEHPPSAFQSFIFFYDTTGLTSFPRTKSWKTGRTAVNLHNANLQDHRGHRITFCKAHKYKLPNFL